MPGRCSTMPVSVGNWCLPGKTAAESGPRVEVNCRVGQAVKWYIIKRPPAFLGNRQQPPARLGLGYYQSQSQGNGPKCMRQWTAMGMRWSCERSRNSNQHKVSSTVNTLVEPRPSEIVREKWTWYAARRYSAGPFQSLVVADNHHSSISKARQRWSREALVD
jgi:hypothetical protein